MGHLFPPAIKMFWKKTYILGTKRRPNTYLFPFQKYTPGKKKIDNLMPAFSTQLQVYFDINVSLQNIAIVLILIYSRP